MVKRTDFLIILFFQNKYFLESFGDFLFCIIPIPHYNLVQEFIIKI